MRVFVAGFTDAPSRRAVAALMQPLLPALRGYRLVPPENLHVTLRFLGAVDDARIPALRAALTDGLQHAPDWCICRAGAFVALPRARPRVLALQLDSDGILEQLAASVSGALHDVAGAADHDFRAHLSVARLRGRGRALHALPPLVGSLRLCVGHFGLYRSDTRPDGARYAPA